MKTCSNYLQKAKRKRETRNRKQIESKKMEVDVGIKGRQDGFF